MERRNTPHPTRTEFEDWMDLSDGRVWMLCFENTETPQDVPRLFLEQFPGEAAYGDLREDGRVWFYPEDMPQIIETLTRWLESYRQCAREDASGPQPAPNWGALEPARYEQ